MSKLNNIDKLVTLSGLSAEEILTAYFQGKTPEDVVEMSLEKRAEKQKIAPSNDMLAELIKMLEGSESEELKCDCPNCQGQEVDLKSRLSDKTEDGVYYLTLEIEVAEGKFSETIKAKESAMTKRLQKEMSGVLVVRVFGKNPELDKYKEEYLLDAIKEGIL